LLPEKIGEGLEPTFARDGGSRATFRFEREVEKFERLLVAALLDLPAQLRDEGALSVDRLENRPLAVR
jgi:hypothetical protein